MYNADEILKIAVFIEENGALFYRKSAEKVEDKAVKKSLIELAEMEDGHILVFTRLRKELTENTSYGYPEQGEYEEASSYLKAIANTHIFKNQEIENLVNSLSDIEDVLDTAMRFEKDSVVLFSALKEEVSEELGKEKIDIIIVEELKHISLITKLIQEHVRK